jgi:hypothetical protein
MNEIEHRPWGKARSFAVAMGCGVANALLGALGESLLPFLAVATFVAMLLIVVLQLGSPRRPFRWIAWSCLVMSMFATFLADFAAFAHAAGG